MFKGFELFSGELNDSSRDIRFWMPGFFDKMETDNDVDLKIPAGRGELNTKENMSDINNLIQNKKEGLEREKDVAKELEKEYPSEQGYDIVPEATLRDKDGNIVKDDKTGEARRIDFVVVKDGKSVDSVEVTSKTADKTAQSEKETRIRDSGGNYIKDSNGNLVEIPKEVKTRIERRD